MSLPAVNAILPPPQNWIDSFIVMSFPASTVRDTFGRNCPTKIGASKLISLVASRKILLFAATSSSADAASLVSPSLPRSGKLASETKVKSAVSASASLTIRILVGSNNRVPKLPFGVWVFAVP